MKKQPSKPAVVHIEEIKPQRYAKPTTVYDVLTEMRINYLKNLLKVSNEPLWHDYWKFIGANLSGDVSSMDDDTKAHLDTIVKDIDAKKVSEKRV